MTQVYRIRLPHDFVVNRENKMTREEAINIVNKELPRAKQYVEMLEALGLIKFEEPKENVPSEYVSMVIRNHLARWVDQPMLKADGVVNALYLAGYMIVKKGEN